MQEIFPEDYEGIKDKVYKDIWSLVKMYRWFGIIDFGIAILFLLTTRPNLGIKTWMWGANIMFLSCLGGYWITKGEDLRKKLK